MPKRLLTDFFSSTKKILIAAGGTGGHLFPAQALANQLLEQKNLDLFFAGAKLSTNTYFDKERFRFYDITSTTPFRGGIVKALKSIGILIRGMKESYALLSSEKPDLIVGFGSFHVFPLLCAASIRKIPIVLFESNAIPGKVVRLFSKKAKLTGIYFSEAKHYLKGATLEVEIPKSIVPSALTKHEARTGYGLDPDITTLLIFGGSQGAQAINRNILALIPQLKEKGSAFQIIHLTGSDETAAEVSELCRQLEIPCVAKKFEKNMHAAWSAADVVICRAGATTLSELLHHEVPGILIPYPAAADQHQLKNALFVEKNIGGAVTLIEKALTTQSLIGTLLPLIAHNSVRREEMKTAIQHFKSNNKKANFCELVLRSEL